MEVSESQDQARGPIKLIVWLSLKVGVLDLKRAHISLLVWTQEESRCTSLKADSQEEFSLPQERVGLFVLIWDILIS